MTDPDGGRPDDHDPTARYLRAAPARSALTLRLVLASSGLVIPAAIAVVALATDGPAWLTVLGLVLVVVSVVDLVVVARRKRRGELG